MPALLSIDAVAGSTIAIIVTFKDEEGELIPDENLHDIVYSILDKNQAKIKSATSLTPSSSVGTIVISGDDLKAPLIHVKVEGTFDSTLGNDLPLKGWCEVQVLNPPPNK